MQRIVLLLMVLIMLSCGGSDEAAPATDEISSWFSERNLSISEVDGVFYAANVVNPSGESIQNGNVVAFYYSVFDLDDNLLASRSRNNRDSILAKIGADALFPVGLEGALLVMRTGEIYDFVLPPEKGYGAVASGIIPNDEPIRVRIETVAVFSENEIFATEATAINNYIANNDLNNTTLNPEDPVEQFSSGIAYKRRATGTGNSPINGDTLLVNFQLGELNGFAIQNQANFEYVFGSDFPRPLFAGFEFAVGRILIDELALVLVPSSQGYRESVAIVPSEIASELVEENIVPPYALDLEPYSTLFMEIRRVK